jgi:hypothetical protein
MAGDDTLRAVRITFSYETYLDSSKENAGDLMLKAERILRAWDEGRYPFEQELLIHAVSTLLGICEYNRGDSTRLTVECLDEPSATSMNGVVVPV